MSNRTRIVLDTIVVSFVAWLVVGVGFVIITSIDNIELTPERLVLFWLLSLVHCVGLGAVTAVEKDEKRKNGPLDQ